ncbi:MAG: hypothetical protein ACRCZM_04820 [Bacteroidales bacterium]
MKFDGVVRILQNGLHYHGLHNDTPMWLIACRTYGDKIGRR